MHENSVIPGRRNAVNPESMNTALWNMDSGFGLWPPRNDNPAGYAGSLSPSGGAATSKALTMPDSMPK